MAKERKRKPKRPSLSKKVSAINRARAKEVRDQERAVNQAAPSKPASPSAMPSADEQRKMLESPAIQDDMERDVLAFMGGQAPPPRKPPDLPDPELPPDDDDEPQPSREPLSESSESKPQPSPEPSEPKPQPPQPGLMADSSDPSKPSVYSEGAPPLDKIPIPRSESPQSSGDGGRRPTPEEVIARQPIPPEVDAEARRMAGLPQTGMFPVEIGASGGQLGGISQPSGGGESQQEMARNIQHIRNQMDRLLSILENWEANG